MKPLGIIVMLSILPRLIFGGQGSVQCQCRCHTSLPLSASSRLTSHRRRHPLPRRMFTASYSSTPASRFQVSNIAFCSTTIRNPWILANAYYGEMEQSILRPMPKVTRHRVSSAASMSASVDNEGNDDEDFGMMVQNNASDNRPKASLFSRSAYQFYPIKPGSSRPMPPSVSDYYSTNKCNTDDEISDSPRNDIENYDDYPSDVYDSMRNPVEGSSAKKTFRNIQPREPGMDEEAMVSDATEMISSSDDAQDLPDLSRNLSGEISNVDSNSYKRIVPRARVTPSFMEPTKVKAMVGGSPTGSEILSSDDTLQRSLPAEASDGNSSTSHLTALSRQLEHLTLQIYQLNDGVEFNINSPKQVARVLFGDGDYDTGTNKDVLEAMASAGNEMASCIFKYRKLARDIKREERRLTQQQKGDKKNDYYGNLARHDDRKRNGTNNDTAAPENDESSEERISVAAQSSQLPMPVETGSMAHRRREPLLLIDASAYIFRAYHAIPPLHRSDGTPTGALHGVCRMLQNLLLTRLIKGDRPRVVLAFDYKGPNFRHEIYPDYKANRGPCPEDLVPQFELVREAADAFGVVQVEAEGYEADDVIATLTRQALNDGVDVDILSGDKDLMQLITPAGIEPSVHMIDPMHFDRIDHDDVVEKWGVSSDKLGDILALAGDSSDNIPGAPGIGQKIAATLINEFGSLNNLIENADTIKQKKRRESLLDNAEKVLLFRKLVSLDDSIPITHMTLPSTFQDVSDFRMSPFDPNRLISFYKRMELNSCEAQLESRLRSGWSSFKPPPSLEDVQGVPF